MRRAGCITTGRGIMRHGWGDGQNVIRLGLKDGSNSYAFVRANPIRLVDPNGTQSQPADEMSPEVRAAWEAAERANFDEASVTALVQAQDRDFERRDLPLATRQALLERATVRATTSVRQWEQGNYGTAIIQGGAGVVESLGLGLGMFGESLRGTAARMTAFTVAPTVIRRGLGRVTRFVAGRGTPPPPLPKPELPVSPTRPPAAATPPAAPPVSPPNTRSSPGISRSGTEGCGAATSGSSGLACGSSADSWT